MKLIQNSSHDHIPTEALIQMGSSYDPPPPNIEEPAQGPTRLFLYDSCGRNLGTRIFPYNPLQTLRLLRLAVLEYIDSEDAVLISYWKIESNTLQVHLDTEATDIDPYGFSMIRRFFYT